MNTVDVAREAMSLPPAERYEYVQRQMMLLIGRYVSEREVLDALADARRANPQE